jgi:redox-sensitive bicupin YhaK (pirin superfamily)
MSNTSTVTEITETTKTTEARPRTLIRTLRGMPTSDGAGVKLTRVIGTPMLRNLDPFLMLDEIRSDEPGAYIAGFPNHPHRGFETITYVLAGRMRHRDNQGNEGVLEAGGGQWMTAARGIVHSEMPEQENGLLFGFQLWLNLPAKDKMQKPWYRDLAASDVVEVTPKDGVKARLLAGSLFGKSGPIGDRVTEPLFADLALAANARTTLDVPQRLAGFVYVFEGEATIGGKKLGRGEIGVLGEGATLEAASETGGRFLLIAGKPLREPIVQYGPFVMNTREEIEQAFDDFQSGRF